MREAEPLCVRKRAGDLVEVSLGVHAQQLLACRVRLECVVDA